MTNVYKFKPKNQKKYSLYHYINGRKIEGLHSELTGDYENLKGDCSFLTGDCSNIQGDCTGLKGDCTWLWGDLDLITKKMREQNSCIKKYTEEFLWD